LTPRAGARLQGFDDDFEFAGGRTEIVKQIGNAVPPLLGESIGRALGQALDLEGGGGRLVR
jgi:DNA (cytosine-5)-methyltransferase 1